VIVGLTLGVIAAVKAEFEYHCMLVPAGQVPDNVAEEPLQILGEFRGVGAVGIGVTVTVVLSIRPLHAVFAALIQVA
jgi:hypothetical protein